MAVMQKCCCCGVKSGSTASGWYTLVIGALTCSMFAYLYGASDIIKDIMDKYGDVWKNITNATDADIDKYQKGLDDIDNVKTWLLVFTIFFGCVAAFSILLLIGVCNSNKFLLLPWMPLQAICAVMKLADGIVWGMITEWHAIFIGHFIILVLFAMLDIYCLVCVISHFQNLSDGIMDDSTRMVTVSTTNQSGYPPPPYGGGTGDGGGKW